MNSSILLEVFKNAFSSIAEEMGLVLQRTAFSPNIKERRDFSCAVFDKEGNLVAQAAHIPVHLGSMPLSVKEAIKAFKGEFEEGDMVVLNDPYMGGTHLPDITLVAPFFYKGELLFFLANRAHHADVGGATPGSMPLSTSIFQEGFIIPPLKLMKRGELNEDFMKVFLRNVRTPEEREGDFKAQIMANITGIKRLRELIEREGIEKVLFFSKELMNYSERIIRERIKALPEGEYEFEDYMEDDGYGRKDVKIHLKLKVEKEKLIFDFSKSDDQTRGGINAVRAITLSAVYYAVISLLGSDIPVNEGCFRPLEVITRKGSVVDAEFPAGVAGGNVETSQRIVDVVLGAFSKAIPEKVPAASQGTMNHVTIGGINPENGEPFTYYETIGGGMGASAKGDGESAVHSHMTNTLNTPIEALEHYYPILVTEYSIRKGSGGEGMHRGGDGIVREYEFLTDVEVTVLSERRRLAPYGLFGGKPGMPGINLIKTEEGEKEMPSKFSVYLKKGDRLRVETPGGGGYMKEE
ncbi:hydantoinase B/oxoprolinase family protein [Aquifex aeolicus]|uniref:N-methylhydantoinase B n=1 Tax=Aquifex aeolicus (strain VF5) TaxID=224324 RepID=O67754_AQUAE|nr:hydantoinase B/oxoprolinase family protein [Aquifex aeolicus]AAC07716.1 N-methylhydantoinase B [Aquifex aeolicus VF5]